MGNIYKARGTGDHRMKPRKRMEMRPDSCLFCPNPWKLPVVRLTMDSGFSFDFCNSCLLNALLTNVFSEGRLAEKQLRRNK